MTAPSTLIPASASDAATASGHAPTVHRSSMPEVGQMTKCDLCYDYREQGQDPACAEACPSRAGLGSDRRTAC